MFERFTRDARHIATAAAEEGRALGAEAIEPEHLLIGVLRAAPNRAADALSAEGVDLDGLRHAAATSPDRTLASLGIAADDVRGLAGDHAPPTRRRSRHLRFAPASKGILERAPRIAMGRGDRHIGAEHVLLALLTARPGHARRVLDTLGVETAPLVARL